MSRVEPGRDPVLFEHLRTARWRGELPTPHDQSELRLDAPGSLHVVEPHLGGSQLASSISLATYSVRLRDRADGEYVILDSFRGHDFLEIFCAYLDSRGSEASEDEERQHLLRLQEYKRGDDRTLAGLLEAGEYGFEAELYNVDSRTTAYRRTTKDAELLPFYFLLSVPPAATRGILVLERFRQFGIRAALWKDFLEHFANYREEFVIELEPLIPVDLIEKIRQSEDLKSVRFIRFGIPSDIADALDPDRPVDEEEGVLELVVKARPGAKLPALNRVTGWLRGEGALGEIIELHGLEFDHVKVQVDIGGKQRTIDIGDTSHIRALFDVTGEVERDESGHPRLASIDGVARDLLGDLHIQLGLG